MAYRHGDYLVVRYEAVPARRVTGKSGAFEDSALISDGAFRVDRILSITNTGKRCRFAYLGLESDGDGNIEHVQTEEPFLVVMMALAGPLPPEAMKAVKEAAAVQAAILARMTTGGSEE